MSYSVRTFLLYVLAIAMLKLVCGVRSHAESGLHSAPHLIQQEPERGKP